MSKLTGLLAALQHHHGMTQRTDSHIAMQVDLTLILLPIITWLEASVMLPVSGVPAEVAARVLVQREARRAPTAR